MKNRLNFKISVIYILLFGAPLISSAQEFKYKLTELNLEGKGFFIASGINNSGIISGYFGSQVVRWKNGVTDVLPPISTTIQGSIVNAAINDSGLITASSINSAGSQNTVIWDEKKLIDLGSAGSGFSRGFSINSKGQVAGSAIFFDSGTFYSDQRAVLWSNGSATLLSTSKNSGSSIAYGINDSGVVTGYECNVPGYSSPCSATIWDGANSTKLVGLSGNYSEGYAINNGGKVAGTATLQGDTVTHAVSWQAGAITDLGTLGGDYSFARAINSSGQIVGGSTLSGNLSGYHATLWNGTSVVDLNSLLDKSALNEGWVLASAIGINDNNQIIGMGYKNGVSQSFLLSPVPEPKISHQFLLGFIGIIFYSRLRKINYRHRWNYAGNYSDRA